VNNAGVVGAQTGWNTRAGEEQGEREEEEEQGELEEEKYEDNKKEAEE
jgi:hypothetical protein